MVVLQYIFAYDTKADFFLEIPTLHSLQSNAFSPICVYICIFRSTPPRKIPSPPNKRFCLRIPLFTNPAPHSLQINGFILGGGGNQGTRFYKEAFSLRLRLQENTYYISNFRSIPEHCKIIFSKNI